MGESKVPIFAYIDESGNTGKNIFDESQPNYYTAALVSKGDFDLSHAGRIRAIAAKFNEDAVHSNELGFGKLELVAGDLFNLLDKAGAYFFVARVEKRYLLATKLFDVLFDSGENAAVAWHNYNIRPLKIILAMKLNEAINEDIAKAFWGCLLASRDKDAWAALPPICESLKARLHHIPDQRSRDILDEGLNWIIKHPQCAEFATTRRAARQGHLPNLVAFSILLQGLQDFSERWRRKIAVITHDKQSEFGRALKSWHGLFSNASPDLIHWAGESYSLQWAHGSEFIMKNDQESAGIQIADVALWLYSQMLKGKSLPPKCLRLLNLILERGWHNDFSFSGVERSLMEHYGNILFEPMEQGRLDQARRFLDRAEEVRKASMAQYAMDGIPPFMRDTTIS
jgi:hypothetical protein